MDCIDQKKITLFRTLTLWHSDASGFVLDNGASSTKFIVDWSLIEFHKMIFIGIFHWKSDVFIQKVSSVVSSPSRNFKLTDRFDNIGNGYLVYDDSL